MLKDKRKRLYLTEPPAKVLLPVVVWRTLRNEDPVGPTGQRGDEGQIPGTRAGSTG